MIPEFYWIPGPWSGRLAVSARPRGGDWLDDEVQGWRRAGVDVVVSLLSADEEHDLELTDEGRLAKQQGIRFISFPITDRGVPTAVSAAARLLEDLRCELEGGKTVAVHCRQGIGRSALIAAGVLVAAGNEPKAAVRSVSLARGLVVPETQDQRSWIEKMLSEHLALARR